MPFRFSRLQDNLLYAVEQILPCSCALCGATAPGVVCTPCAKQYINDAIPRCRQCALPVAASAGVERCGACLRDAPHFDTTIVATDYMPPVDQLVLALKFGGTLALAPFMASALQARLSRLPPENVPSVLIPVPLGSARLAERGFNQAMEIARPLARSCGIRVEAACLKRIRETRSQSLLPPEERRQNVRKAFIVPAQCEAGLKGLHVGIVDDVMTTGETLDAIASVLKRSGVARVTNIVFARTVPK